MTPQRSVEVCQVGATVVALVLVVAARTIPAGFSLTSAMSAVFMVGAVDAQTVQEKARKDEIEFMPDEEPAMKAAFARARSGLDQFLEIARSHPPDLVGFAVKVGIKNGEVTEYFWISDFTETAGRFEGKINNKPRLVGSVKFGQAYGFSRAQIVDWTYIDKPKKKMFGNYTMCALLTKESPEEAEAVRKRFKLDCG